MALSVVQWRLGVVHPLLYALGLFMGVSVAVISHNHNHLGIWKSKALNQVTNYVIALYYGYPAIGWVPTHNQGHHKYNNRPGDSSISPRFFKGNHLLSLLVYPTLTGMHQSKEIFAYIGALRTKDRRQYWAAISEYAVFLGIMAVLFFLDWRKTLFFFVIPQQFALFAIQVFNYIQHIEAAPDSAWNHSRNFVSPVLNALLFNNGYHTVHHFKPGLHWSQTPELHAQYAKSIHPSLLVPSFWGFMFSMFIARPLLRPFRGPVVLPDLREYDASAMPSAA
ncbi:MAG: fatty acid desaturase family protein [Myxococcaceae bacterium]